MIVLRIHAHGSHRDVRLEKSRLVIGSDPGADVVQTDVGWAPEEVELLHRGTEVELRRIRRDGDLRLRLGDEVRIGHARIALVGLLPLAEGGDEASADAPRPELEIEGEEPAPDEAAADPAVVFGDYEFRAPAEAEPNPFALVDELAPPSPKSTPAAPPKDSGEDAPTRQAPPSRKPDEAARTPPAPRDRETKSPKTTAAAAATAKEAAKGSATKGRIPLPRPPSPAFRHQTFGEELVRTLKRAPFFLTSVGIHLVVFLVLALLQEDPDAGGRFGEDGTIHAALSNLADRERVSDDEEEELENPVPLLPEIPTPELPDDTDDRIEEKPADGDTLEPLPDDEAAPFRVGLNPSLSSVQSQTGRRQQTMTPGELKESFTKHEAITTNAKAADYVRGELGRGSGRQGNLLKTLSRNDLLVVDGTFDKVGRVLHALKLPFLTVSPRAIAVKHAPDLSKHKVIFWNCGESLPPDQLVVATRRLRSFVKKGGYLFTTDWAIGNVVQLAFPGYLSTSGPRSPLPETTVGIEPARGKLEHNLLKGVFPRGAQGRWWLEQASFDIKVMRKHDVEVLITSSDLEKIYNKSPVVAATFVYGRGRVLHVMGHYFQEMGNMAGAISAQRLALNFVLERLGGD